MLNVSSACEEMRKCPEKNLPCTVRRKDDFVDVLRRHFLLGEVFSIYDVMRVSGFRMTDAEQLMRSLERKEIEIMRDVNGNLYFLFICIPDE